MPVMSRFESAFCRSWPWRMFAERVVLPWALQRTRLHGSVLEIGAGSGAMAAAVLQAFPDVAMTVTDFDERMVANAATRLGPFTGRATPRQADATALPFADESFDAVLSWIMLHHTVEWERALAEAFRVVRPGGRVIGYDLLATVPMRLLHQAEGAHVRMMHLPELRRVLDGLDPARAEAKRSALGLTVRVVVTKPGVTS